MHSIGILFAYHMQSVCSAVQTVSAHAHFGRNGIANKTIIVYHMQHKNDRDFFWKYIEYFCILHVKILL